MPSDSCVVFKGRKDGLTIALDDKIDFKDIKAALALKLSTSKRFFDSAETSVLFKGRALSEEEEIELREIITDAGMSVNFLGTVIPSASQAENAVKSFAAAAHTVSDANSIDSFEYITKFIMGSLRSGQSAMYGGSVVVVGDVNPGAEIIADGNIIILGALNGLAHAGRRGDVRCFVCALKMKPTQLRIADIITRMPEQTVKRTRRGKESANPLFAYARGGQIYISELS